MLVDDVLIVYLKVDCHFKIFGLGYIIIFQRFTQMMNGSTVARLWHSWGDLNLIGDYKRMSIKYFTKLNGAVSLSLGVLQVRQYFKEWQIRLGAKITSEAGHIGYL